jgi:hypothetical protein
MGALSPYGGCRTVTADDGLDDVNWQILSDAVAAAHRSDVRGTHLGTNRFDTDVAVDGRAGTYIWWLLRYKVAQMLGRRPSEADLHDIAAQAHSRFAAVIREPSIFESVLLTAWKLAPPEQEVTGGRFLVAGVTALGVLMDDPAEELARARPDLSAWWRTNVDKFRAQGILENRARNHGNPQS